MSGVDPRWCALALAPPRAAGDACGRATLRAASEDFVVEEQLGFVPSGAGEHLLLRVRKRDTNTGWVAKALAVRAGVRPFEVGYAGVKDRRAVTTQWFSIPRRKSAAADWSGFAAWEASGAGFEVLEAHPHARKLPRGALAGNRFSLLLREVSAPQAELESRLATIARQGVPNYFGPQRFGRLLGSGDSSSGRVPANLESLQHCLSGAPLPRDDRQRGFLFSAARSLVFNAVLAERIQRGDWWRLHVGERANLDGSNSTFRVEHLDATLEQRLADLDIHPTGPLPGLAKSTTGEPEGDIAQLEAQVLSVFGGLGPWLQQAGVESARRPLRMAVRELEYAFMPEGLHLQFSLRAGSFATTVVRELCEIDSASTDVAGEEDA